ncbi:hypothetical protein C9374_009827 [Naegleria lovaniensis]|uniref:Uncharacterized protein n=1 Tax=Naegleria lovaniensis TaxID=51637 RepID=A0AA88KXH6_NAELO|nr:uncharacterized protein C9374_009827 [Naegleria lovaniensis]KAG2393250.1 hypothetical protein C9374_009827 [Naegleria lovaniensis]
MLSSSVAIPSGEAELQLRGSGAHLSARKHKPSNVQTSQPLRSNQQISTTTHTEENSKEYLQSKLESFQFGKSSGNTQSSNATSLVDTSPIKTVVKQRRGSVSAVTPPTIFDIPSIQIDTAKSPRIEETVLVFGESSGPPTSKSIISNQMSSISLPTTAPALPGSDNTDQADSKRVSSRHHNAQQINQKNAHSNSSTNLLSAQSSTKRRESVFNEQKERVQASQKYEYVVPTLLPHNPQTINDLYIKTLHEKNYRSSTAGSNESKSHSQKRGKSRPHTATGTFSRRGGIKDEDDDENVLNSSRIHITSADLIVDTGMPSNSKTKKRENVPDSTTLLGIPGIIAPPKGDAGIPYNCYKNAPKSNAEHLILRHSSELLAADTLSGQITSDYYEKLEQDLWKFEHVSRGKNRNVMITHGNTVKLFNRGEPVEEFYNKYLLYQKDLIEKHEDFESMQQTMKRIRLRMKPSGSSPVKAKGQHSETKSEKKVLFIKRQSDENVNKEPLLCNNLWERKKKKRLKPISQFVQEQVGHHQNILTSEQQTNAGGTFITEVNTATHNSATQNNTNSASGITNNSPSTPLRTNSSQCLHLNINSPAGKTSSFRGSFFSNQSNSQQNVPLSARSVTSSIGTNGTGTGYDLFITDEQADYAERNKKAKVGLIETIKRASGCQEKTKGTYITGVNHSAQSGIGGIVARFPAEELGVSDERLKRIKAKEMPLDNTGSYHTIIDVEEADFDYAPEDLEKVFPPIKIATFSTNTTAPNPGLASGNSSSNSSTSSLHALVNNPSNANITNTSAHSASFRDNSYTSYSNPYGSNIDYIIENIRAKIQYKNISNINVDELNTETLRNQIVDEQHEQMLDEKLQQYDTDFKVIIGDVHKITQQVAPNFETANSENSPYSSSYSIKKQVVEINGETFYKTKDLSPRKSDSSSNLNVKKKRELKKPKIRNVPSGTWRNSFISCQTKQQYELLVKLDDRSENRNVVAESNEHLSRVSKKVMHGAERMALYGVTGNKKFHSNDSLWDKAKKRLDIQTTKFYQSVLFYKRLLVFLEVIQAPSQSNRLLLSFLNRIRTKLINNPTCKQSKENFFFSIMNQVVEEARTMSVNNMTLEKSEVEETPLDLFFSNRETIKVIQFFNAEYGITHDDLFNYLNRLFIKQNKLLLELKVKMKQKEEQEK